jgi:hypothetical protein
MVVFNLATRFMPLMRSSDILFNSPGIPSEKITGQVDVTVGAFKKLDGIGITMLLVQEGTNQN